MIESITKGIATTAQGFACVVDGVLDIRTIGDTRKGAALRGWAMRAGPLVLIATCPDPDCDCTEKVFIAEYPDVKIVTVEIKVIAA